MSPINFCHHRAHVDDRCYSEPNMKEESTLNDDWFFRSTVLDNQGTERKVSYNRCEMSIPDFLLDIDHIFDDDDDDVKSSTIQGRTTEENRGARVAADNYSPVLTTKLNCTEFNMNSLSMMFPLVTGSSQLVFPSSLSMPLMNFKRTVSETSCDMSTNSSNKKRKLSSSISEVNDDCSNTCPRFKSYQTELWAESFRELCEFRRLHGHCQVPNAYETNPSLIRWVKRQRYQYKLLKEGIPSTMTEDRIKALEDVGFVWDSHESTWEERMNELRAYKDTYGHCNVPSSYPENMRLATWVRFQRRQYKLFWEGKAANITIERIDQLQALGFEWSLRQKRQHKK